MKVDVHCPESNWLHSPQVQKIEAKMWRFHRQKLMKVSLKTAHIEVYNLLFEGF